MFDNRQKHGKASELPILFYPNLVSSHLTCSYCPSEICGLCIIMFRFVWTCTVVISLQRSSAIVFSFSFFFILVSVSGVPVPSCFLCFCVVPFWCYSSNTNGTSFGLMCHVCSRKTAYIFYFFIENGCSFSRWEFDASSCVKIHQFYTHKLFLKSKRQSSAPKQNSSICNLKRPPPPRARAKRKNIFWETCHLRPRQPSLQLEESCWAELGLGPMMKMSRWLSPWILIQGSELAIRCVPILSYFPKHLESFHSIPFSNLKVQDGSIPVYFIPQTTNGFRVEILFLTLLRAGNVNETSF